MPTANDQVVGKTELGVEGLWDEKAAGVDTGALCCSWNVWNTEGAGVFRQGGTWHYTWQHHQAGRWTTGDSVSPSQLSEEFLVTHLSTRGSLFPHETTHATSSRPL